MRPSYETDQDRGNERIVRDILMEYHNCAFGKLTNAHYVLDYCGYEASTTKIIGWFEIKCRNMSWGQYDTIMLSLGKWREGLQYFFSTGVPFYFVVSTYDGVFQYKQSMIDVKHGRIICEYGGRTEKTRDAGDVEPVMMIPIDLFEKISSENCFTRKANNV